MQLFTYDNNLLIDIEVDDSTFRAKKLMEDNILSVEFSMVDFIDIPEGTWTIFKNEKYTLLDPANFVKNSTRNFSYSLLLDSEQGKLKYVKYKLFTVTINEGEPDIMDGSPEISFPLYGRPIDFIKLMVDNLNFAEDEKGWKVGECTDADPINIDFNDMFCFDVLGLLADKFKTEWEIDSITKTIHLRKVEYMKDAPLPLAYGEGKGLLPGLGRTNMDTKVINRVYAKTSERNIDYSKYGSKKLLMPGNRLITYEGIDYKTDSKGTYLERVNRIGRVKEGSVDATEIYPMKEGTVTAIDEAAFAKGIHYFFDENNEIDFTKEIIPGNKMILIFQRGADLSGIEFDVSYNHLKKRFQVITKQENGIEYPSANLTPSVGDIYAIFNINLPQEYIDEASEKVLQKSVQHLYVNEKPQYSYNGSLDKNYAEENWGTIGGYMNVGYYVKLYDYEQQILPEPVNIRVVEVKEYYNNPLQPELTLADKVTGKTFTNKQKELENQETTINRKDEEVRDYIKRGYRDVEEMINAMYDPGGEFQNDLLSTTVLSFLMGKIGSKVLQIQFLGEDWSTEIQPFVNPFNPVYKKVELPYCRVRHLTLGIDSIQPNRPSSYYFYWEIQEYISDVLAEIDTPYYLYMQCEKDYEEIPVLDDEGNVLYNRKQGKGIFLISEERLEFDSGPYYNFWIGYFNSENEENRSFRTVYGYTEILPGQMTVNNIYSSDGSSFLKLLANQFRIGNESTALEWNIIPNMLRMLNASFEIRKKENGKDVIIASIDGDTGAALFGKGAHKFNPDSSLNFANGNFLYDLINGLSVVGKVESNSDGHRIVIDPVDRCLKFLDGSNRVYMLMTRRADEGGSANRFTIFDINNDSKTQSTHYQGGFTVFNDETYTNAGIGLGTGSLNDPFKIFLGRGDERRIDINPTAPRFLAQIGTGRLNFFANYLPTSAQNLRTGQIWNDNGTLKIVQ